MIETREQTTHGRKSDNHPCEVLGVLELNVQEALLVVGLLELLLEILDQVLRLPSSGILELFCLCLGRCVVGRRGDLDVVSLLGLRLRVCRSIVDHLGILLIHDGQ